MTAKGQYKLLGININSKQILSQNGNQKVIIANLKELNDKLFIDKCVKVKDNIKIASKYY